MSTVSMFFNRTYLGEVEDAEVTPGVRYLPRRATSATVSIALGGEVLAGVMLARATDELLLVTAAGAIYQLLYSVVAGNILTAEIEPRGMIAEAC